MLRRTSILFASMLFAVTGFASLSGCGNSCQAIQDDIEKIGAEISKKPETAMDRSEELEKLRQKLEAEGCLGKAAG
jgi:hypothetical protein